MKPGNLSLLPCMHTKSVKDLTWVLYMASSEGHCVRYKLRAERGEGKQSHLLI